MLKTGQPAPPAIIEQMPNLYQSGLGIRQVASTLGCSHSTVRYYLKKLKIPLRSKAQGLKLYWQTHPEEFERFKEISTRTLIRVNQARRKPRRQASSGYVLVYSPEHPRADSRGRVPEHILIWEQIHQKQLPSGWVTHHLNGVRDDNRSENLTALPTQKHSHLLQAKAKRIRELEGKVKLLERALDQQQLIWWSEN